MIARKASTTGSASRTRAPAIMMSNPATSASPTARRNRAAHIQFHRGHRGIESCITSTQKLRTMPQNRMCTITETTIRKMFISGVFEFIVDQPSPVAQVASQHQGDDDECDLVALELEHCIELTSCGEAEGSQEHEAQRNGDVCYPFHCRAF